MPKFFEKVVPMSVSAAEAKAQLPEPEVSYEVEQGSTDAEGETTGAAVIMHVRFPLDYDESLAFMRKRSLIIGQTRTAVPVQFAIDGSDELQTLAVGGSPFLGSATLSIYQEKEEKAETGAETAENIEVEDTGAQPVTA